MYFGLWTADFFGISDIFCLEERKSHVGWPAFSLALWTVVVPGLWTSTLVCETGTRASTTVLPGSKMKLRDKGEEEKRQTL